MAEFALQMQGPVSQSETVKLWSLLPNSPIHLIAISIHCGMAVVKITYIEIFDYWIIQMLKTRVIRQWDHTRIVIVAQNL